MSKRKPDQVIEFRISLQDREREMFDTLVAAQTFNRIATPNDAWRPEKLEVGALDKRRVITIPIPVFSME